MGTLILVFITQQWVQLDPLNTELNRNLQFTDLIARRCYTLRQIAYIFEVDQDIGRETVFLWHHQTLSCTIPVIGTLMTRHRAYGEIRGHREP